LGIEEREETVVTNRLGVGLGVANLVLLAFLLLEGSVGNAAPEAQPVVRAELIELVDGAGLVRAQIRTEEDGTVVFRLRDAEGNVRVKLAADEMGSGLLLADETTGVGVHILSGISRLTNQRGTMITLADPGGVKRVIRPGDADGGR